MKRCFYLFLFLLLGPLGLHAAPSVQLRVDVNPKKITIGDPIDYMMTVMYSSSVSAAPLTVPALNNFEVLMVSTGLPELVGDKFKVVNHFILTTFSTGTQTIPAFTLQFAVSNDQMAQAQSEPVDITVRSLLTEKGDLGGLRPPKGFFDFRSYFWIWLTVFVILFIALMVWMYRIIKRKIAPEVDLPKTPPVPPEQLIWSVIQRLEDSDWIEKGLIKEYYSDLSTALRQYIENRFGISVLDKTTSELIQECRKNNFSLDNISLLRDFFEGGDLVKFAKFIPLEDYVHGDLERVKKFVSVTIPQKETATEINEKNEAIPV